jgi:hypothetical protein
MLDESNILIFSLNPDAAHWRLDAAPFGVEYMKLAHEHKFDMKALTSREAAVVVEAFAHRLPPAAGVGIGCKDLAPNRPVWYTSPAKAEDFLRSFPTQLTAANVEACFDYRAVE